jgi:hypothetical protein
VTIRGTADAVPTDALSAFVVPGVSRSWLGTPSRVESFLVHAQHARHVLSVRESRRAAGTGDAAGGGAGFDTPDGTADAARPAEEPQPAIIAPATAYAPGNRISRMVTLTGQS